jgi:hypothetical protein
MQQERLTYLFERWVTKTCSEAELLEFTVLINSLQDEETIKELFEKT